MAVNPIVATHFSCQCDTEGSSVNPRIRSVMLHIRARYGAWRILGIGRGAQTLCRDLRNLGYSAAAIEPGENGGAGRFCPPFLETSCIQDAAFDMAVSIESDALLNTPAALVALAASHLAHGGVFVLSMPYGGSLKNLLITLCEWWRLPFYAALDGGYLQRWSRKSLIALLEAQHFTVMEFIGVRGPSLQWESLVLVAKKTSRPAIRS